MQSHGRESSDANHLYMYYFSVCCVAIHTVYSACVCICDCRMRTYQALIYSHQYVAVQYFRQALKMAPSFLCLSSQSGYYILYFILYRMFNYGTFADIVIIIIAFNWVVWGCMNSSVAEIYCCGSNGSLSGELGNGTYMYEPLLEITVCSLKLFKIHQKTTFLFNVDVSATTVAFFGMIWLNSGERSLVRSFQRRQQSLPKRQH